MTDPTLLEDTLRNLDIIEKFDPETLARTKSYGEESGFLGAVSPAKDIIQLFGLLNKRDLSRLNETNLRQILQLSSDCITAFNEIIDYSQDSGINLITFRDQKIDLIKRKNDELKSNIWLPILISNFSTDLRNDIKNVFQDFEKMQNKNI